jgi:hypothetical protein
MDEQHQLRRGSWRVPLTTGIRETIQCVRRDERQEPFVCLDGAAGLDHRRERVSGTVSAARGLACEVPAMCGLNAPRTAGRPSRPSPTLPRFVAGRRRACRARGRRAPRTARPRAGAQVELAQDVADVRTRRALADRQLERDLLVRTRLSHVHEDLAFAGGELIEARGRRRECRRLGCGQAERGASGRTRAGRAARARTRTRARAGRPAAHRAPRACARSPPRRCAW